MDDIVTAEAIRNMKRENEIAKNLADYLQTIYPDYQWACNADIMGGVVHIYNLNLSGKWGFLLKIKDVVEDGWKKVLKNAGGELLERYHLARGRMNQNQYMALPTDKFGQLIADK